MTVCLLDEIQEVMQDFKPEPVALDPDSDNCSWRQVCREESALYIQDIKTHKDTQTHTDHNGFRSVLTPGEPYIF